LHHSSLNAYSSEIQGNIGGLEDLEFVEDPLVRRKNVDEVINRVELDLIDDDLNSLHSDSNHQSAHNTIDEARRYVLKQQLKYEMS